MGVWVGRTASYCVFFVQTALKPTAICRHLDRVSTRYANAHVVLMTLDR